ncbi:cupin domain-containing protein [Chryseolinea sp. T2]|uniref:cupin domain-containing protein n=1 Tax=Chryseolinea sp. T2 TaxID=3129255 RepID=UPI003077A19D
MNKRVFHNPVIGDRVTLLKSSDETNGETTLMEIIVNPGGGNTLHRHIDYSEKFEVLNGDLTVTVGDQQRLLRDGDTALVMANTMHCFNNHTKKPVKFLAEITPAQPGFEKAIAIGYGLATDGLVDKNSIPKNIRHMAVLVTMSGIIPSGVFRWFMPLLRLIASRSQHVESELVRRYC